MSDEKLASPGYIGGSVLSRFLAHPDFASFEITTLVRSTEKAEKLKALGLVAVVGSHSDEKLVEALSADSDVVIAMVCMSPANPAYNCQATYWLTVELDRLTQIITKPPWQLYED